MPIHFTYVFDPLCGWCYGASPVVQSLGRYPGVQLNLAPSGLFARPGRTMDADFAQFAWSNDQRIQTLTGQRFTEAYREQVLGRHGGAFDSTLATLALTAVSLTQPLEELDTLQRLQEARYLQGLDTCDLATVADVLRGAGQGPAADLLCEDRAELHLPNQERMLKAQRLMRSLGAQGVPVLVHNHADGPRALPSQLLYGTLDALLAHVGAA